MKIKFSRIFLFLSGLLLFFSWGSLAQDNFDSEKLFYQANYLYKNGEYQESAKTYEKILAAGFDNGETYYNLANAYFKGSQLGRAVLNYEKSCLLMPRDRDLRANYEYAKAQVKNSIEPQSRKLLEAAWANLSGKLSVNEAVIVWMLITVLFVAFLAGWFITRFSGTTILILIVCGALFFGLSFFLFYDKVRVLNRQAIVLVGDQSVKFEPTEEATVHFTLPEGAKVKVLGYSRNWVKIERVDHKIGWLPKNILGIF
jgi:tetratricopeptide (TPR) repeat protein